MMYRDLPIEQFALDAQQKGAIGIILGSSIDGRLKLIINSDLFLTAVFVP